MPRSKKIIFSFYSALIAAEILLSFFLFFESKPSDLKFLVFDVGQGDAIFIRTPAHYNILIDGGPDNSLIYKLGQYLPFYDRQIDLMILTHPHSDHVVGLVEVLRRYKVKKILATGVKYSSADYSAWLAETSQRNIEIKIITQRESILLVDQTRLDILFPDKSFSNQEVKNLNNTSIVVNLTYQDAKILLMGDYEDEETLVKKSFDLQADILKVGHHGSITANSFEFLKLVKPTYAIISCGQDNKFNLPNQQILSDLEELEAKIFRTDQNGDFYWTLKKNQILL